MTAATRTRPLTLDEELGYATEVSALLHALVETHHLAIDHWHVETLADDVANVLARHGVRIPESDLTWSPERDEWTVVCEECGPVAASNSLATASQMATIHEDLAHGAEVGER